MSNIRAFEPAYRAALIALWERCELTRPWIDPAREIDLKLAEQPDGLMVAVDGGRVIGSVMVGYEGHRGWINYLGVDPAHRREGLGRALMAAARDWLTARACPKINLQVRIGNERVLAFYKSLGFVDDQVVSLGLRLEQMERRPD